jgi:ATP-binding cassette, subfamily C, bacterial
MLILDEISAGLDPQAEAAIVATIGELKGKLSILVISHEVVVVEAADAVNRLNDQLVHIENDTANTPRSLGT